MRRILERRPSPSMVVAFIALVAAMAGTGYAASQLPNNSVGTNQLKNNAVTGKKIKNNAVTAKKIKNGAVNSNKVKNGSLLSADFKAGQLPAGPQGARGPEGPHGPAGAAGANAATNIVVRQGAAVSVPNTTTGTATVSCNPGEKATGGGSSISGATGWAVVQSFPTPGTSGSTPTGWRVDATNNTGSANNLVAIVICASP